MKKQHKMNRNNIITSLLVIFTLGVFSVNLYAQDDKQKEKELKESQKYLSEASAEMKEDNFPIAEADYRKAIALNPANDTGKYNLGTAYYGKNKNTEAMERFKQAASVATTKPEKHKAFHNLGNTYMNEKKYTEAVEAYKNALRNNPTDEESRYNLALAKDLLEKNPPPPEDKNDKNDENKDNKDNKENEENKDKNDKGDNKEGDEGDKEEDKDKGDQKDENKEGENEKDKGQPDKPKDPKEGEGDKPQQQQPVPGKLSPQQVKSLLEAMNNEEKKVQDKINAQKQKGAKVKSNKDW